MNRTRAPEHQRPASGQQSSALREQLRSSLAQPLEQERRDPRSEERRKHLDLAHSRQAQRHARIMAELPVAAPAAGPWRRFVAQFGWRAYALPLLVIITALALVTSKSGAKSHSAATALRPVKPAVGPGALVPTAAPSAQLSTDVPNGNVNEEVLASNALPNGAAYAQHGDGSFLTVPGHTGVFGAGKLYRFSIEVEAGMGYDSAAGAAFAKVVMQTLTNPKSWIAGSTVSFQRVDSGAVDFHIDLTSSMTVRTLCGYDIQIETSCYAPDQSSRVVLNVARWTRGDAAYLGDIASYRQYMVNHETGHAIGHAHAHQCLANGLAPVMMQQTIGLKTAGGKRCQANQWPYPQGSSDGPGAEQPDPAADQNFVKLNS